MRRRAFLATVGLAAISGCIGDSGEPSGDGTPTESDGSSENDDLPVGKSKTQNGIKVTATDATVARQVFGDEDFLAFDGVYLLARVEVENAGDEPIDIPSIHSFSAIDGSDQFEPIGTGEYNPDEVSIEAPVSGETYLGGGEIHPGVKEEGWLIFEVPDEFGDLRLAYSYSEMFGDDAQTGYWDLDVDRDEAARLENVSIEGPKSVEWGETASFTFEAENVGNRTATVIYDAGFGNPEDLGGVQTTRTRLEIEPGDTVSKAFESVADDIESYRFTFNDWKQDIEIKPATAAFGETITTPGGVELKIGSQRLEPYYRLKGSDEREFAEDGGQFSIAHIQAENNAEGRRRLPSETVAYGDEQTFSTVGRNPWDPVFVEPVSGPWAYVPSNLDAGESHRGWIMHKVAGTVDEDEIEIRLRSGDETVYAKWSRESDQSL